MDEVQNTINSEFYAPSPETFGIYHPPCPVFLEYQYWDVHHLGVFSHTHSSTNTIFRVCGIFTNRCLVMASNNGETTQLLD
jgi:hypothetical protein